MPSSSKVIIKERLARLQSHMEEENPVLLDVIKGFRQLDTVAYRLGLIDQGQSLATRITWWPLISVLGTFSSGKSTFINRYLGQNLQNTGNQAVDDKFTVVCYGPMAEPQVLPGLALDNDPRFPLYQISHEIEAVTEGEGRRLDVYLQLKTCNSEGVKGKILIDSPGFDADAQRTATLRITDQIIDLSDLVLVFFDARHPEPGAMRDTLEHLVSRTLKRPDFNKFVFILNQIDNAAREDNPEEVFAAWQRALAQSGLTAGRFYRIYDPQSANFIPDDKLRSRFESKRDADMAEIAARMRQVEVERAYRVTGLLEETVAAIRDRVIPELRAIRRAWKRRVFLTEGVVFGLIILGFLFWTFSGYGPDWSAFRDDPTLGWIGLGVVVVLALWLHLWLRRVAGRAILKRLRSDKGLGRHRDWVANAFEKNIRSWRPFWLKEPVGYGRGTKRRLTHVVREAGRVVQALNDRYARPSGKGESPSGHAPSHDEPASIQVVPTPQPVSEPLD